MNTFTIAPYALDEIGTSGYGRITAKVLGYWSSDSITLYIKREFKWDPERKGTGEWTAQVSHSSGGRDTDEVASDLDATINFAAAMVALAELGKSILARTEGLETAYQCERARRQAELLAEKEALAVAVAADPECGQAAAKLAVDARMSLARNGHYNEVVAFQRGTEHNSKRIVFQRTPRGGVVRITINGQPSSRAEAIQVIAESSQRTVLKVV